MHEADITKFYNVADEVISAGNNSCQDFPCAWMRSRGFVGTGESVIYPAFSLLITVHALFSTSFAVDSTKEDFFLILVLDELNSGQALVLALRVLNVLK